MKASKKDQSIDALLTSLTGRDRTQSVSQNICNWCGEDASTFTDALSEKEYTISGLCQTCQDKTFA